MEVFNKFKESNLVYGKCQYWYSRSKFVGTHQFEIVGDKLNSKCLGCLTCKFTFKDNNNNDDK